MCIRDRLTRHSRESGKPSAFSFHIDIGGSLFSHGSTQGASYAWQDFDVTSGQTTYYWLEEIDLAGATLLHGPVSATYQAPTRVGLIGMQAAGPPDRAKAWLAIPLALVLSVIGGLASRRVWR